MSVDFENQKIKFVHKDGREEEISALDERWVVKCTFGAFYPLKESEQVKIDAWCDNGNSICKSVEFLLRLPHHKFWSYVVYGDDSFYDMLDSYFGERPRYTQPELMNRSFFSSNAKVGKLMQKLDRFIFLLCIRMSTRREGNILMGQEFFGKLIREKYIFDIVRLMSICQLYGPDNEKLVQKIIDHIFTCEPLYFEDLKEVCSEIIRLLEKCASVVDTSVGKVFHMLNINDKSANRYNEKAAIDCVYYLVDFIDLFNSFLKFCPKAKSILHHSGFTETFPSLFDQTYSPLYEALVSKRITAFNDHSQNLRGRLLHYRLKSIELYRSLITHNILDHLLGTSEKIEETETKTKEDYLNDFIETMTHLVSDKIFAAVYFKVYNFEKDVDEIRKCGHVIDPISVSYLSEAFDSFKISETKTKTVMPSIGTFEVKSLIKLPKCDNNDPKLQQVRDIFPDMDLEMINLYLREYDNNVERLVNDLLCGVQIDVSEPSASQKPHGDNQVDDFPDPDVSDLNEIENFELVQLEQSKKRGNRRKILDDKSAVNESRAFYEKFAHEEVLDDDELALQEILQTRDGLVSPLVENPNRPTRIRREKPPIGIETENDTLYNDEYDDTYDSHEVDVGGANVSSEEEETEGGSDVPKQGQSSSGNGETQRPWKGDYTGGKDRQYKERHKGRAAHHNRKDRSLYKHSRGFGFY